MKRVGSQMREPIEESDYEVAGKIVLTAEVVLRNKKTGDYELYAERDDFAGHVIVIDGKGHEFISSARIGDLWWAGINPN